MKVLRTEINWKTPKDNPPPETQILAVIEETAVKVGWAEYDDEEELYYLYSGNDCLYTEGKISFWSELPKAPKQLDDDWTGYLEFVREFLDAKNS